MTRTIFCVRGQVLTDIKRRGQKKASPSSADHIVEAYVDELFPPTINPIVLDTSWLLGRIIKANESATLTRLRFFSEHTQYPVQCDGRVECAQWSNRSGRSSLRLPLLGKIPRDGNSYAHDHNDNIAEPGLHRGRQLGHLGPFHR